MLYKITNAKKIYNDQIVFDNLQFEIKENNDIIGIIGRNGAGKSTLLKVLQEEVELDEGQLVKNAKVRVGYLKQDVFENDEHTVQEEFDLIFSEIITLQKQLQSLETQIATQPELADEYARKLAYFESIGGYTYQKEINTIFTKFGFLASDLTKKIKQFSGGQKTKIAFVKLLLEKPDILLLDEPTNHLDLSTIEWLEGYLKNMHRAVVIVSHDRAFLNNTCNILCEIEFGKIEKYVGNYETYLEEKKQRKAKQHQAFVRQQAEIERLETLIEKFRFKKSKASFVKSKIKYLDRMDKIEDSKASKRVFKANFVSRIISGKKVLECDNLTIGYNKPLTTINLEVFKNDIIAIVGNNGVGKSTFLKTLIGEVPKLSGDFLFGHNVEIGYFAQDLAQLDNDNTVLEEVWNEFSDLTQQEIRTALGSFLFSQEEVFKKLHVLSQGEKVRLALLKLMLLQPNVLILDEPTNHLDIPTKEALEQALMNYDGTILFVSHDRYFINKMANQIFSLDTNKSEFTTLQQLDEIKKQEKKETKQNKTINKTKEIKKIENKIEKLETKLEQKKQLQFLEEYYLDYEKNNILTKEIEELEQELQQAFIDWENFHM